MCLHEIWISVSDNISQIIYVNLWMITNVMLMFMTCFAGHFGYNTHHEQQLRQALPGEDTPWWGREHRQIISLVLCHIAIIGQ